MAMRLPMRSDASEARSSSAPQARHFILGHAASSRRRRRAADADIFNIVDDDAEIISCVVRRDGQRRAFIFISRQYRRA